MPDLKKFIIDSVISDKCYSNMADGNDLEKSAVSTVGAVNLDEIEVTVLILAKHPNGQKQTANFLNKRGWPTTVTGSISEALDLLVRKRPDVVLISFNHPHPAILKLPEVLVQTFNVFCVGFVETADVFSTARLTQVKMLYKLQGFPSGPSIQRLVRRVLEERLAPLKESPQNQSSAASSVQETANGNTFVIKGDKKTTFKDLSDMVDGVQTSRTLEPDEGTSSELLKALKETLLPDGAEGLDSESVTALRDSPDQLASEAMAKVFEQSNSKTDGPLITRRVAVLPVKSERLHGYLVASPLRPLEGVAADAFLISVKSELERNFVSLSVPGMIDIAFWVDIIETDFIEWTAEAAQLSMRVAIEGEELGVAYFPTPRAQVSSKKSKIGKDMIAVSVQDISTDTPVSFKAYLPMSNGEKPYLYLRNGRTLQPEQKKRLLERNVTELYIKSIDLENLKAFIASAYLNSTIKKKAA